MAERPSGAHTAASWGASADAGTFHLRAAAVTRPGPAVPRAHAADPTGRATRSKLTVDSAAPNVLPRDRQRQIQHPAKREIMFSSATIIRQRCGDALTDLGPWYLVTDPVVRGGPGTRTSNGMGPGQAPSSRSLGTGDVRRAAAGSAATASDLDCVRIWVPTRRATVSAGAWRPET